MRVADFITIHLKSIGTDKVFLLSGGGMMHLIDAVGVSGIDYICCHHEQCCAIAAEGYARQTGKLGVCYATSGPGATNILTGLVSAWQDSSPVLFITGQSKRSQTIRLANTPGLRQYGTFEVDIVPIVQSVTKYAHFLDEPQSIRYHLEKAIYLATTGRPGPVLLDIPLDVQGAPIDSQSMASFVSERSYMLNPPEPEVFNKLIKLLTKAKRPILLIGHGVRCSNAVTELRELVHKLGIPTVTTQLAKDALSYDDPFFVGHSGPKGDRPGNFAVQSSDFILSIGSSLHSQTIGYETDLFAPGAFKVQVDIDSAILNRGDVSVDLQINSDISAFIKGFLEAIRNTKLSIESWRKCCLAWKDNFAVSDEPHDITTKEINFYEFAEALSTVLKGRESIVTDAGSAFYVMGQAFRCQSSQRYIVNGALGAMGYALPAAIGLACGKNDDAVVCVTGDGSLQTNIHELQTLKHYNFNIKLFIIQNDGYASIRNTQRGFFSGKFVGASRDSGVSLPPLNKIADAYGLPYVLIECREKMHDLIHYVMSQSGPVICEIQGKKDGRPKKAVQQGPRL